MRGAMNPQHFYETLVAADEVGVRLEMVMGNYSWEFHPSPLHTIAAKDIESSIRSIPGRGGCGCYTLQDVYIVFPDGSFKRPDISIFCHRPEPTQEALKIIPEAVIEVVSPGSESKDLEIGPPFLLSQGVKDVVVFNPASRLVHHFRRDGSKQFQSAITIDLECGCTVTV